MSAYAVNLYTHERTPRRGRERAPLILAYLTYQGRGFCRHVVDAPTGAAAKRAAITEHRTRCLQKGVPMMAQVGDVIEEGDEKFTVTEVDGDGNVVATQPVEPEQAP